MEIVLFIIMGFLVIALLFVMIGTIKNGHCYRLSCQIGQWVLYYRLITDENDIDYDIDCYLTSYKWLNPFGYWTKRSMCPDKAKYDKLKKFIDEHSAEIAAEKRYAKEHLGYDI